MSVRRFCVLVAAAGLLLCACATGVRANTTVTLNATDSGWYNPSGNHDATNKNYIVGKVGSLGQFRDFFVFDLTGVRGPVLAATLLVQNPRLGYVSTDASETLTLYDVTTPASELSATNAGRTDIHADLGSGNVYGATDVPDPSDGAIISVPLNASALAALNAARGLFAVGGALTSIRGQDNEYIFGGSDATQVRQLMLTLGPPVVISEFRLAGAQGPTDEFVELYNNDTTALMVSTADGSDGWALVSSDGVVRAVVPNGTTLPPRANYLVANTTAGGGYSLADYGGAAAAAPDLTYTGDTPAGAGLALFQTASAANFTLANRLDAVGFAGVADALYREGAGLAPAAGVDASEQFSFVRLMSSGAPRDTDDNAQDFALVSVSGAVSGAQAVLGAPAPENLSSPVQRNAQLKATLVDPQQLSTSAPNRLRDASPNSCGDANLCAQGTLTIRRTFKNSTGATVSALRFRVVDITTLNTPNAGGAQADLRALNSVDVLVTRTDGAGVLVKGTTVEQPPAQTLGGGLNSLLVVQLPGGALAPGASVSVQFVLGVEAGGRFRFLVNVEALPQQAGGNKVEGQRPRGKH